MYISRKVALKLFLIAGIFLGTSLPAAAQMYKAKCKDITEGDMDSCRVSLQGDIIYLNHKKSENNLEIDINKIQNISVRNWEKSNIWGNHVRKVFTISWQDESGNKFTSFRLKPNESIELMTFLSTVMGRNFDNEINSTQQAMERKQKKDERDMNMFGDYLGTLAEADARAAEASARAAAQEADRQHELKLAEINSRRQSSSTVVVSPSSNNSLGAFSARFLCDKASSTFGITPEYNLINASRNRMIIKNISEEQCTKAISQIKSSGGFACIPSSKNMVGYYSYSLANLGSNPEKLLTEPMSENQCLEMIGKLY